MLRYLRKQRHLLGRSLLAWLALAWFVAALQPAVAAYASGDDRPQATATHHHPGCPTSDTASDHGKGPGASMLATCAYACEAAPLAPTMVKPVSAHTLDLSAAAGPYSILSAMEWIGLQRPAVAVPIALPPSPVLEFRVLLI